MTESGSRHIRWWALAALAAATAAALLWVRGGAGSGQERWVASFVVGFVSSLLLIAWVLWGAGLRRRGRLLVLAAILGAVAAFAVSVRMVGVTGDLRPVLAWRWGGLRTAGEVSRGAAPGRLEGDFPQFLGPRRDGSVTDPGLARNWSGVPPVEVWRRAVGAGWSGFAVVGGIAVTQEQRGDREEVAAYDLATGRALWRHGDEARYATAIAGIGPRATPTIVADVVFTHGATGLVNALDLRSGELLWQRHPARDLAAPEPEWGRSASPLVVDGKVVVPVGAPGALLVALSARDGGTVWMAGDDRAGYSSPVVVSFTAGRQIVSLNASSVTAHDPVSGIVLWRYPFPSGQPNVAIPLALGGDRLLVSAGYGVGSKLLQVEPGERGSSRIGLLWESPRLKAKFTNPVTFAGAVFGLDDGRLVCLDPRTGERCGRGARYGHGQTLLVGDLLLVQAENGEVALVEATPNELRELGRFRAFGGKTWNPPALVGRHLLLRTDAEAALFSLPLAG